MTIAQFGNVFASLISIVGLWALYSVAYQDYRRDVYRQKLFALRDELFDLARSGQIPFDEPAYGTLRSTLNGFIRFGHTMRLLPIVTFLTLDRKREESHPSFEAIWGAQLHKIDPAVQQQLNGIVVRMHTHAAEQLVLTSVLLLPLAPPTFAVLFLRKRGPNLAKPYFFLRNLIREKWIDAVNYAALQEGMTTGVLG